MAAQKYSVQVGDKFNRLTVVRQNGVDKSRRRVWICLCECGRETHSIAQFLHLGKHKSCGCWRHDRMVAMQAIATEKSIRLKNGKPTLTYRIWCGMKQRIFSPADPRYMHYGGRGITICDRWLSFENFLADMGECPPGRSIDREENDGNYEPGNCRWATDLEQGRNTSKVRLTDELRATIKRMRAEGSTLQQIAAVIGVHYSTVSDFLRKRTWREPGEEQIRPRSLRVGQLVGGNAHHEERT